MSDRRQIEMTPDEVAEFVDDQDVVMVATLGPNGWPHLVPLWFLRDGEDILAWSYGKSQKVMNIQRDPRATLMFEAGSEYTELRGVALECTVEVLEDPAEIAQIGNALTRRYQKGVASQHGDDGVEALVTKQSARRRALRFRPVRTATWDHSKMTRPATTQR